MKKIPDRTAHGVLAFWNHYGKLDRDTLARFFGIKKGEVPRFLKRIGKKGGVK